MPEYPITPVGKPRMTRAELNGRPHQQKPDVDNLTKSLLDALFEDDAHIWDVRVSKSWGETGRIIIEELEA